MNPFREEYAELATAFRELLSYSKAVVADAGVIIQGSAAQLARMRHAIELLVKLVPKKRRAKCMPILAHLGEMAELDREQINALPTAPAAPGGSLSQEE